MTKIVLVTGGFDPLHSGHIEYFRSASALGDELWVGLNSDDWLARKKGRAFMPIKERATIVKNLRMVDRVITNFDDDDGSASGAIHKAFNLGAEHIVFANGGDRGTDNTPEQTAYKDATNVEFVFGVGGEDKKNSSSWILEEWSNPSVERAWGRYRVLARGKDWQVKQLEFDSEKALSDQRHRDRSEHWHVVEGNIEMKLEYSTGTTISRMFSAGQSIDIPRGTWHKAINLGGTARVVEVWLGTNLTEDDIERRD